VKTPKKLEMIRRGPPLHWVGDGFPVRSMFSYNEGRELSPFLLLDYAAPTTMPPTDTPRGVGEHPHRGFETVTIVYQGEVEHRDSAGHAGRIGPGDVQWMTAASGVVHEEKHGREWSRKGGTMQMVQLWVNLPARLKMSPPKYNDITDAQIPRVTLPDDAGVVRVIAGTLAGVTGPGRPFTPINLWDVHLLAGHKATLDLGEGHTTALMVLEGELVVNGGVARAAELALFAREGDGIVIEAQNDARILLLSGEPIDEPVVGYGPFVMNTEGEIRQAIRDYQMGKMGALASA
jgi:redox-sensitive bicupin YhaK (pirin superfamily)